MSHRLLVVEPNGDTYELEVNEANELPLIRQAIGGNVDLGSARPYQFAVGEYSYGTTPNAAASKIVERETYGTVVIWQYGPSGESLSWNEDQS